MTAVDSAPPLVITPTSSVPVPIVVSSQVDSRQPTQMAQVKTAALQTQISNEKPQLAATATATAASGPAIVKFKLNKKNNGLGLSIVAARGTNQMHQGIYIKSVVPGGASDDDGRLNAGDQL